MNYKLITPAFYLNRQFIARYTSVTIFLVFSLLVNAQQITGVWRGKINKKKVEVKIIQKGDSLTGTSYYYESKNNYLRYSIKGYFDPNTNSAIWWDDQLIQEKHGNSIFGSPGKAALLSVADFNCPGGSQIFLDGRASAKENREEVKGPVNLQKVRDPSFEDEWDFVIDNYTMGGNDPYIIDSIRAIALNFPPPGQAIIQEPKEVVAKPVDAKPKTPETVKKRDIAVMPAPKEAEKVIPVKQLTIEEKFTTRKKILTTEIPLEGDSIELRFYDNAEVDGDSISLFLNDRLIFQHIRLTEKAYRIKIPVSELANNNELIMVAENLGSIPPNTSYMVCIVGEKRFEANLASTENSSAMIRLIKKAPLPVH